MEQKKSVVAVFWYNVKEPLVRHLSTGFIINKGEDGIFILSVSEFIPKLFKDSFLKSEIGVQVFFFDRITHLDARVLHYDLAINMAAVFIKHCTEFDKHPLICIQAASLSTDPTYKRQSVKAVHHTIYFRIDDGLKTETFNQFTKGFVADSSYLDSGLVHFSMPLIFRGSLGAPVFDKHSNKVVSMIKGWESGLQKSLNKPFDPKHWSDMQNRYFGLSVPRIQEFLDQVLAIVGAGP